MLAKCGRYRIGYFRRFTAGQVKGHQALLLVCKTWVFYYESSWHTSVDFSFLVFLHNFWKAVTNRKKLTTLTDLPATIVLGKSLCISVPISQACTWTLGIILKMLSIIKKNSMHVYNCIHSKYLFLFLFTPHTYKVYIGNLVRTT